MAFVVTDEGIACGAYVLVCPEDAIFAKQDPLPDVKKWSGVSDKHQLLQKISVKS